MRWFRYNVDEFHSYCTFTNCEFAVLTKPENESKLAYVVEDEETTGRGMH